MIVSTWVRGANSGRKVLAAAEVWFGKASPGQKPFERGLRSLAELGHDFRHREGMEQ